MAEEKDIIKKSKTKGRQAMLEMAKNYEKNKATIQHAIEAYKEVVVADSESEEAEEAREALLRIAQKFEREGKKESAFHIYRKLAQELPRKVLGRPVKY